MNVNYKKNPFSISRLCAAMLMGGAISACQVEFTVDGTVTGEEDVLNGQNVAPIALADSATTNEDENIENINVLANDTDANTADTLTLVSAETTTGSVTVNADNTLTYMPPLNFFGDAVVNYTVSDGTASATGTLTVNVVSVNDNPVAEDDITSVEENSSDNIISVLDNDSDIESSLLTIDSVSALFGQVSESNGDLLYTPFSDSVEQDLITYAISDGDGGSDTASVTVDINPASNNNQVSVAAGRPIVVSFQPRSGSENTDAANFNDWVRYDSPVNVNEPIISADGSSITFSRTNVDDGLDARDYVAFKFGERFAGASISVSMNVTAHDQSSAGIHGGSLHVASSGLTGETTRYATEEGTWATVLRMDENANDTFVRVGLGAFENDTSTNSITISDVQVSYLSAGDDEPNEYVSARRWTNISGFNGAALPYSKEADYNEQTGFVTFNEGQIPETNAASHVMLVTDSFGNFFTAYTRDLFFGGVNDAPPSYAMTINTQAGRQLEDVSDGVLLEEMFSLRAHPKASAPGVLAVHLGVNTFMLDQGTTADLAELELQKYIDFAHTRNMVAIITTATPFKNSMEWTQAKQIEMNAYNASVRALENGDDIRVVDLNALLDTDGDEVLDAEFLSSGQDYIHAFGPATAIMYNAYDQVIKDIIAKAEQPIVSNGTVQASLVASRNSCVSPCTVVFSAVDTEAEGLDEHEIWHRLIYRFDFYDMPEANFALSGKPEHYEVGGPMATRTLLCETGTCQHRVGLRVQNEHGDFDDTYTTITVNSESTQFALADTICVSNTLDPNISWDAFDKDCPVGAVQQSNFPLPDDYEGKLVLAKRGDVFDRNVYPRMGQSNFKLGYFGDSVDARPEIGGTLGIGPAGIASPLDNPGAASTVVFDDNIVTYGWTKNVVVEGFRVGRVSYPLSYEHIGIHDMDLDQEFSLDPEGSLELVTNAQFCHRDIRLDCSNVPFPKGAYISDTKIIGSQVNANVEPNPPLALNIVDVPCGMVVYTGIVGTSMGNAGEHNFRHMGWWKANISHSNILGNHKAGGKSGLTIRPCGDAFALEDFTGKYLLDPEGRTRDDADTGSYVGDNNDDYSHLSRYYLVQNNTFGTTEVKEGDKEEQFGMAVSTIANRDHYMQDILASRNVFVYNTGDKDINGVKDGLGAGNVGFVHGSYLSCIGNTYADGNSGCDVSDGDEVTRTIIEEGPENPLPSYLPLMEPGAAPQP